MSGKSCQGLTLIELLMVLSVAAILAATAIPSFYDLIGRQRLKSAAGTLFSDLQAARFSAIKLNKPVSVVFQESIRIDAWCYGLSDSGTCRCNQSDHCRLDDVPATTVTAENFRGVRLQTNFSGNSVAFNPIKGASNAGTVILSRDTRSIKVIVSTLGRIRTCSDNISGHPPC